MEEIKIHYEQKKLLSKEFSVSAQSVDMALKYVFNSEKAKKIRARAKELLLEEARKIKG